MAFLCEICGYQAKTSQGLAGHKQFKHQLAEKFPKPSELAQRVNMLQEKEAQLALNIRQLEERKARLEQSVNALADLEKRKAELEKVVRQLEEISQVKTDELTQRFRQELIAMGWYPVGKMDARQLGIIAFLKWASKR